MRKHIVFLATDFSSRTSGGIGTYIETMATSLTEMGHTITVVVPSGLGRSAKLYRVIELAPVSRSYSTRRIDLSYAFAEMLSKIHSETPITVVEATDYGIEGLATMREGRFPLIVRLHTPDSIVNRLNQETRLLDSNAVAAVEEEYFSGARYLSAPSNAMKAQMLSQWAVDESRIETLPNPVIFQWRATDSSQFRNKKRLAFFGRLERRKGVFVLAEALQRVLSEDPKLEFEFIGANTRTEFGSVGVCLKERLAPFSDRVRFLGHFSGQEKFHHLQACDCVVLPSLWENFPYACLEVIACGKPVLATEGCGYDEMIQEGRNGRLVPPGNSQALAQSLLNIAYEQFPLLESINQEILQSLSPSTLLPRFEAYYQRVAQSWI